MEEEEKEAVVEDELPSPEELIPLSLSLVTPNLASAFDIPTPINPNPQSPFIASPSNHQSSRTDSDSGDLNRSDRGHDGGTDDGDLAKSKKKRRVVWTLELHKKFVDAVARLGLENAIPKAITEKMNVDGLTRESVASHLQKYRIYLREKGALDDSGVKRVMKKATSAGDLAIPSPLAPAGYHEVSFTPLNLVQHHHQQQQLCQPRNMRHLACNVAACHRGFSNITPSKMEHVSNVDDLEERRKELIPSSQVKKEEDLISLSLVTPNPLPAFDIPMPIDPNSTPFPNSQLPSIANLPNHQPMSHTGDDDEFFRATKRRKRVWTSQLHKKFSEAVARLGLENVTPRKITEIMNVDGLSIERVSSHLQQYRLYLQRKGVLINSEHKWHRKNVVSASDSSTDQLSATSPLPRGAAPARGDERSDLEERSEEGCGEIGELSLLPTGQDLSDDRDNGGGDIDKLVRTTRKGRTVWTPQLHKKFAEAVVHLGWENTTPKAITEMMNVDGLSRVSVSSHLRRYKLYLQRIISTGDSTTDWLFATSPLPHGSAPARGDERNNTLEERSEEGCGEIKGLSLFPTGKDLRVLHLWNQSAYWHLGLENATPVAITQTMNVDGLSRDSMFSHLQQYRLFLQHMANSGGCPFPHVAAPARGDERGEKRCREIKVLSLFPTDKDLSSDGRDNCGCESCNDDEPVRTKKKQRTVWTLQLHKQFAEAMAHLELENTAPSAITQTMNVDGLSRGNVSSHLQQYRLYRQLMANSGSSPLPRGAAPARGDERSDLEEMSKEGCREIEGLLLFPIDKDSSDGRDNCGSDDDEFVRTKRRRRTLWTPQLHKKFSEALAHLGMENATPSAIMQTMNVDGLSRESVSSHLQQYRSYLERKGVLINSEGKWHRKKVVSAKD